jgi:hypothetical protein
MTRGRIAAPANDRFHNPLTMCATHRERLNYGLGSAVAAAPDQRFQLEISMTKIALMAAVAVLAVSAAAPASAHYYRHHQRHHVWVHHGSGAYAYAPHHRRVYNSSNRNERRCQLSPGSPAYEPCMNRP